ncbi:MAG: beta-galactosidase [Christensenellales bacterium]
MKWNDNIIYYGGDYNPDQWDETTVDEDIKLFKKANINFLVLPVFSWTKLEPKEGQYEFDWLEKLLDKLYANGLMVSLATPTCAQPAWLSIKYPEVLPVDIQGRKRKHGMRVFFCYNSDKYRERARAIADQMARRFGNHPAVKVWHVANEYGTYCYCDHCEKLFRDWLKERYSTLDELNNRWNTAFWNRTLTDWNEITLPSELNDDYRFNPTVQLDFQRFVSESTADCFSNEYDAIRAVCLDTPINTNMSGFIKKLDQFVITSRMDIVGWDNYPWPTHDKSLIALKHDIMRGLKDGQSFMLSEQSPNQQNWQPYNKLKKPGEVRLLTYQALAHGADTCLFFQMRQSIAGQEKFHGAVISRSGDEHTRIFKELTILGNELSKLGQITGARINAEVGILFDWNNWWALENSSGPSKDLDYLENVQQFYRPFYEKNIPVDILGYHRELKDYKVVVAPLTYMMKPGLSERLTNFVKDGGTLIATYLSGVADENDRCVFGEYPGPLKEVLGIAVEETDALYPEERNTMVLADGEYSCSFLCDLVKLRGAQAIAVYGNDFYKGLPCLTVNQFGKGKAYYIATLPEARYLDRFVDELKLDAPFKSSVGVEITKRVNENGSFIFCINHNSDSALIDFGQHSVSDCVNKERVTGQITLAPHDCRVFKEENQ